MNDMNDQANEYTLLNAGSDFSDGDACILTDQELGLVLGGNISDVQGQDTETVATVTVSPGPAANLYVGFQQGVEVARDAQDYAQSAEYYGRHGAAEAVDTGSKVAAGYAGGWAPVVISAGEHIANWIRPDGPPPVDHDSKK
jgi:hypothetical protein